MIHSGHITALVLAGGRGSRMGGVNKGLQNFQGTPLALHTVLRLQMQDSALIGSVMINANRDLAAYEAFGVPVWPDQTSTHEAGPLAGFATGLQHCPTPYLLTVPCDTPLLPLHLAEHLAQAFVDPDTEIAMAASPEPGGQLHTQPVFCLMRADLFHSLGLFMQAGGRKIDRWTAQHNTKIVPFDQARDRPEAFYNANTLAQLRALEQTSLPPTP